MVVNPLPVLSCDFIFDSLRLPVSHPRPLAEDRLHSNVIMPLNPPIPSSDDDANELIEKREAYPQLKQIVYWAGLAGLIFGFAPFALGLGFLALIDLLENNPNFPTSDEVWMGIWVLIRHGAPLSVWLALRRRINHFPVALLIVLAFGFWYFSWFYVSKIGAPMQW